MDNPYQAPRGHILTPTGGQNPQTWKEILFSFTGRIPRRQYWGAIGIQVLVSIVFNIIIAVFSSDDGIGIIAGIILIPFAVFGIWSGIANRIKRWHDRDKSGWWMFIVLIPIIGAIWAFVECGCLRGTEGSNRFGDDPT